MINAGCAYGSLHAKIMHQQTNQQEINARYLLNIKYLHGVMAMVVIHVYE